jgi:hypothetical protein
MLAKFRRGVGELGFDEGDGLLLVVRIWLLDVRQGV